VDQQKAQDRGLKLVEARVVAHLGERLFVARAVVSQCPSPLGDGAVIGHDRSSVAKRRKVLRGIERQRRHVPQRPGASLWEAGTCGLRRILEHRQPQFPDLGHRRGTAEQVDGQDGGATRRERRPHSVRGHVSSIEVDIAEHGPRASGHDRLGAGVERERRHHDLIARADPEGSERDRDGIRSVGDPHREADIEIRRELPLERADLGTEDEPAPVDHFADAGGYRPPQRRDH
jgi:hypothetical protein